MKNFLEKTFQLEVNNTSIKQEFLAGFTTFITMAYIIFVNPQMMAASGMDLGASFVGTCIAAAIHVPTKLAPRSIPLAAIICGFTKIM